MGGSRPTLWLVSVACQTVGANSGGRLQPGSAKILHLLEEDIKKLQAEVEEGLRCTFGVCVCVCDRATTFLSSLACST